MVVSKLNESFMLIVAICSTLCFTILDGITAAVPSSSLTNTCPAEITNMRIYFSEHRLGADPWGRGD